MNNARKIIAKFDICLDDLQRQHDNKMKIRNVKSDVKEIIDIDIKYKIVECSINNVESYETANNDKHDSITTVRNPFEGQEEEEVDGQVPNFHPNSCIIVLGTTGRGKTTTMNLYTGNTADTGDASHSTTKTNKIYHDQVRHYLQIN